MKKIYILIITFCAFAFTNVTGQVIFTEDFDGSNGTNPPTLTGECIEETGDYFGVVDNSLINVTYGGAVGNFLSAQDTDGIAASANCSAGTSSVSADINGIDISTCASDLYICFDIADAPASDGNDDWDASSSITINVDVDGTGSTAIANFAGTGTNTTGVANGDASSSCTVGGSFTTYCASIPAGSLADINIAISGMDAGNEDVGVDNILLVCGMANLPAGNTDFASCGPSTCDLTINPGTAICDAETAGTDTYTATFTYSDADGSGMYNFSVTNGTLTSTTRGIAGGPGLPNAGATGTITVDAATEGTDVIITITDGADCNIMQTVTSPVCAPPAMCQPLVITEVMYDPCSGAAGTNNCMGGSGTFWDDEANGEWVEIYNYGSTAIDVSGYLIGDSAASDVYEIPAGTIIPPGGYLVVGQQAIATCMAAAGINAVVGCVPGGCPTPQGGNRFNNGGDDVELSDPSGNLCDVISYTGADCTGINDGYTYSLSLDPSTFIDGTENDNPADWGPSLAGGDTGSFGGGSPGVLNTMGSCISNLPANITATCNGTTAEFTITFDYSDSFTMDYDILVNGAVNTISTSNPLGTGSVSQLISIPMSTAASTIMVEVRPSGAPANICFDLTTSIDLPACMDTTPELTVTKSATDGTDAQYILPNGDAVFNIVIENTGATDICNIVITDPNGADCVLSATDIAALIAATGDADADFEPGESITYTCMVSGVTADFTNEISIDYEDCNDPGTVLNDTDATDVIVLCVIENVVVNQMCTGNNDEYTIEVCFDSFATGATGMFNVYFDPPATNNPTTVIATYPYSALDANGCIALPASEYMGDASDTEAGLQICVGDADAAVPGTGLPPGSTPPPAMGGGLPTFTCPQIYGILSDACGDPEGPNEFAVLVNGNDPLGVSSIDIDTPSGNDYDDFNTTTAPPSWICPCCIYVDETATIPANATVIVTSAANTTALDFTSLCNAAGSLYVVQDDGVGSTGHFSNSAGRATLLNLTGTTSCDGTESYSYVNPTGMDGFYTTFAGPDNPSAPSAGSTLGTPNPANTSSDGSCTPEIVPSDPAIECFGCTILNEVLCTDCNISAAVANVTACDNAGTLPDDTDDTFSFTLDVTQADASLTGYTFDGTALGLTANEAGTYGAGGYSSGNVIIGAAAGTTVSITLVDNVDPSCTAIVMIDVPVTCSECPALMVMANPICSAEGITFDIEYTIMGSAGPFTINGSTGQGAVGTIAGQTYTSQNTKVTLTIEDESNPGCIITYDVLQLNCEAQMSACICPDATFDVNAQATGNGNGFSMVYVLTDAAGNIVGVSNNTGMFNALAGNGSTYTSYAFNIADAELAAFTTDLDALATIQAGDPVLDDGNTAPFDIYCYVSAPTTWSQMCVCAVMCPTVVAIDTSNSVCDGALAAEITDWQTAVESDTDNAAAIADANTNAAVVYSSAAVPVDAAMPDGIVADGVHSGADVCVSETQTTFAYLLCFGDDGMVDTSDDTYLLLGTHSLTVYPAAQTPTITLADDVCNYTISPSCPNDVLDVTTTTAMPGEDPAAITVMVSTENNCMASFQVDPPACPTDMTCSISGLSATPSACNPADDTYSVDIDFTVTNPGTSGMYIVDVCGITYGPFNYANLPETITGLTSDGMNCDVIVTDVDNLGSGPNSFISEIHYDNDGGDIDESIEISGSTGTNLAGYSIVLYNGNGGSSYNTIPLNGIIGDDGSGCGSLSFDVSGIQNGGPDGIALVDANGIVIEFLSYEGSFVATNGPAMGLTSTDIGASEPSNTPVGSSLELTDGGWVLTSANTFGTYNVGLTCATISNACEAMISYVAPASCLPTCEAMAPSLSSQGTLCPDGVTITEPYTFTSDNTDNTNAPYITEYIVLDSSGGNIVGVFTTLADAETAANTQVANGTACIQAINHNSDEFMVISGELTGCVLAPLPQTNLTALWALIQVAAPGTTATVADIEGFIANGNGGIVDLTVLGGPTDCMVSPFCYALSAEVCVISAICGACPVAATATDSLEEICDGDLGTIYTDWQASVATANPLDAVQDPNGWGSIVYSGTIINVGDTPSAVFVDGIHNGINPCFPIGQEAYAYLLCDQGTADTADDIYELIGSFILNIFIPPTATPPANPGCGITLVSSCDGQNDVIQYSTDGGNTYTSTAPILNIGDADVTVDFIVNVAGAPDACQSIGSYDLTCPCDLVIGTTTDSPVCESENVEMTVNSVSGGVGPYTYEWFDPSGNSISTNSTYIITMASAADAGTYTVTVTDSNACAVTENINIVINDLPIVTIEPQNDLCIGDAAITLVGMPAGGTWSGAADASGNFDPAAAGVFSANYTFTDANNCSATAIIDLVVNELPTVSISGTTNICLAGTGNDISDEQTVLDAGAGFTNYLWSTSETTSSIVVNTAGTYDVTVSDANGCMNAASVIINAADCSTPCTDPTLTAVATCTNSTDLNEYYIEVTTATGGAGGSLIISDGASTQMWTGSTLTFGPYTHSGNGLGIQTIIATDDTNPSCSTSIEVIETLCGPVEACDCNNDPTPGTILAQAAPGTFNTNGFTQWYVLVDATGNIITSNGTGLFTLLADGNYEVYAINVEDVDLAALQAGLSAGTAIADFIPDGIFMDLCYSISPPAPYTIDCMCIQPVCAITPAIATNIVCNNNGTPADPADDTYTFDITVNGSSTFPGATNTFNDNQGNTGIAYGTTVSYGPYPISGGNVTVQFTDADEATCTGMMMGIAPLTCSGATCGIIPDIATNIVCNDNGTPADPADDTYTFDVTVNGSSTFPGATNTFNDDQGNTGIAYGITVSYGPYSISSGNITVQFTDADEATCTGMMMAAAPLPCSGATCGITPDIATNIVCNDNGTPADPTDDTYTFDITVNGSSTFPGASNTFNDDQGNTGIAYGTTVSYGPYSISSGNITVQFTDADEATCTGMMMAAAPLPCSGATCGITPDIATNIVCNDNGTPADPTDDTYTFDITVNGSSTFPGASNTFNDDQGNTGIAYGTTVSYGPYAISGGNITVQFTDADEATCTGMMMAAAPNACSIIEPCDCVNAPDTPGTIYAVAEPGTFNTDGFTQFYVLVDVNGNIVSFNSTGLFTMLAEGNYEVYAVNVDDLEAAALQTALVTGTAISDFTGEPTFMNYCYTISPGAPFVVDCDCVVFTCPGVGPITNIPPLCDDASFEITVSGLSDLDQTSNGGPFGIDFVYFTSSTTNPYSGGTSLGAASINGSSASISGVNIAAGTYYIYAILSPATTEADCQPFTETIVTVNSGPMVMPTTNPVCFDDPASIMAGVTGGTNNNFTWTTPSGTINNNQTFTLDAAQFDDAGIYTLTVTDANGCSSNGTVELIVNPLPELNDLEITICEDVPGIPLDATVDLVALESQIGPAGGTWTQFPNIPIADATAVSFLGVNSIVFNYTYTDGNGCNATASVTYTILQVDNNLGVDYTICAEENPIDLTVIENLSGGVPGNWTDASGNAISDPSAVIASTTNNSFTFNTNNEVGCPYTITANYNVLPALDIVAVATCNNADNGQYFIEVNVNGADANNPVVISDGTNSQTSTGNTISFGPYTHSGSGSATTIISASFEDGGCAASVNVLETLCADAVACDCTAYPTPLSIFAAAEPGTFNTDGYSNLYILADGSGNIISVNATGLFTGLADNTAYEIYAANVDNNEISLFDAALLGSNISEVINYIGSFSALCYTVSPTGAAFNEDCNCFICDADAGDASPTEPIEVCAGDAVGPFTADYSAADENDPNDGASGTGPSSFIISEVDADQAGNDMGEFVELYGPANAALDGYVLIFYNGSDDLTYNCFDLDGYSSDANGYFTIGNLPGVSYDVSAMFPDNLVQNGADAVALVQQADCIGFENDGPLPSGTIISSIVYGTNDGDDSGLLTAFGGVQYDEDANGLKDVESNQWNGSTYEAAAPTPGGPAANFTQILTNGYIYVWVVTDGAPNYNIVTVQQGFGTAYESSFNNLDVGTYCVHGLSFQGTLNELTDFITVNGVTTGVEVANAIANQDICADLIVADCIPVTVSDIPTADVQTSISLCNSDDGPFATTGDLNDLIITPPSNGTATWNTQDEDGNFIPVATTAIDASTMAPGDYLYYYIVTDGDCQSINYNAHVIILDCTTPVCAYNGIVSSSICNADGTFDLVIDVTIMNPLSAEFNVIVDGLSFGPFMDTNDDGTEQVSIPGIAGDGTTGVSVSIEDGSNGGVINPDPIFLSEIHYDNFGTDIDETIEITSLAGTDLSNYELVLYNGNGGIVYSTIPLTGIVADDGNGYGADIFSIPGIQNGAPDAIALVDVSDPAYPIVVQFLSYEGVFIATDGPAYGLTTEDIGVSEPGEAGESLQLTDVGWIGPAASSFDAINSGLTVSTAPVTIDCSYTFTFDEPACGVCSLTATATPLTCDYVSGFYFVDIEALATDPIGTQFTVELLDPNGNPVFSYGTFDYTTGAANVGPFTGDNASTYSLLISDAADASCNTTVSFGPIDCNEVITNPSIDIDKNSTDGSDTQLVIAGNMATFVITVTNNGDEPLENVQVTDPLGASCEMTFTDADNILDAGEVWTYTCTVADVTQAFTNTATVTGTGVTSGTTVTDVDESDVEVEIIPDPIPSISIDKDSPDGTDFQTVLSGSVATFVITVTNDGEEDLENVVVTDPNGASCEATYSDNAGILAVGESWTYTCTVDNVTADFINTAFVTGTGVESGNDVNDNDPTTVMVEIVDDPCDAGIISNASLTALCDGEFVVASTTGTEGGSPIYVLHDGNDISLGNIISSSTDGTFTNDGSITYNVDLCITAVIGNETGADGLPDPNGDCYDLSNCMAVVFLAPIEVATIETCNTSTGEWSVAATITGGGPGYLPGIHTFNIQTSDGTIADVENGVSFDLGPFASNSSYSIEVLDDGKGCTDNFAFNLGQCEIEATCNFDAGVLSSASNKACFGSSVNSPAAGVQINDPNAILTYVLHDGFNNNIGTILGTSQSGLFMNDGSYPLYVEMYICSVVGYPSPTGLPDLSDACTDISDNCTPVRFLQDVSIDVTETCNQENGDFFVSFEVSGGTPGYQANALYNVTGDYNGTAALGQEITFGPVQNGNTYTIVVADDKGCSEEIYSDPIDCKTLPIELISFTGEAITEGNNLKWVTATEIDNDYFTLERSVDGINFTTIDSQAGAGTTSINQYYDYLDKDAPNGLSYYRLWQTDYDGTTTEAGIVTLQRGEHSFDLVSLQPVPVMQTLEMIYTSNSSDIFKIKIIDALGRIMYENTVNANSGTNYIDFDVSYFTSGMYFVELQNDSAVITKKFVKQ